ncbi:MAG: hypothetical protein Kow0067_00350 [Coriobacteriia bacterium]
MGAPRKMARALFTLLNACIVALSLPAAADAAVPVTRIAGSDRYATAVAVSRTAFPTGADAVVIATGRQWADALGGSGLAGAVSAPVLLTEPDRLPASVRAEIGRLAPARAYVLGGASAITPAVLEQVRSAMPPGATIVRLAGADRYLTAIRVAAESCARAGASDGTAFVATGRDFADALSVAPVAFALERPVYLIEDGPRSETVIAAMRAAGVTDAVVLGGTAAVPAGVERSLAAALGGSGHVTRLAGRDRHATAILVGAYAVETAGFSWSAPGLAASTAFADGITGGSLLGTRRAPLLLTPADGVPDVVVGALYARRDSVDGYTVVGGAATVPRHIATEAQQALVAPFFSAANAMTQVCAIAGFGARGAGSVAERRAFDHISAQLRSWGYTVTMTEVDVPDGLTSHNVIAEKTGSSADVVLIGAHVDSKPPSPGANDNASGCAVALELARVLAEAPVTPTVRFVFFGAEEISGDTPDDHHFGSRQYVASLGTVERSRIHAMVSVDMVGYGPDFHVRSLGTGPWSCVTSLQAWGAYTAHRPSYLKDLGRYGWSDHEAFERAGIPATWIQWRDDPVYHTAADVASHVQSSRVRVTGRLLRGWILALDQADLDAMR